jgi:hypothetical protein
VDLWREEAKGENEKEIKRTREKLRMRLRGKMREGERKR